jgi:hypothetical protein
VADLSPGELSGALAGLERAEFIFERSLYPEAEYAFLHPLTQEVGLQSQLSERRKRINAAIARAIETLRPDRLDEEAGVLAHHWEEAGEVLQAARWHHRAALRTEDTNPAASIGRWHRVRSLLAEAVASSETTTLRMQACRGILSAYLRVGGADVDVESLFAEGKALVEQAGDLRLLASPICTETRRALAVIYGPTTSMLLKPSASPSGRAIQSFRQRSHPMLTRSAGRGGCERPFGSPKRPLHLGRMT